MTEGTSQRVLPDESLGLMIQHLGLIDVTSIDECGFVHDIKADGIRPFNFEHSFLYYTKISFPKHLTSLQTIEFMGFNKGSATFSWNKFTSAPDDGRERLSHEAACYDRQGRRIPFSASWYLPTLVEDYFVRYFFAEIKRGNTNLINNLQKIGLTDETMAAVFRIGAESIKNPPP